MISGVQFLNRLRHERLTPIAIFGSSWRFLSDVQVIQRCLATKDGLALGPTSFLTEATADALTPANMP